MNEVALKSALRKISHKVKDSLGLGDYPLSSQMSF